MDFKEELIKLLKKETKLEDIRLEVPPDPALGDYAFPCFALAKTMKKAPAEIAKDLAKKLRLDFIEKIEIKGPYLNFFLKKELFAEKVIKKILKEKEDYGKGSEKKKIIIEFPSPNTNKPLHLGHVRNMAIGQSVTSLLNFAGNKVIITNLNNDRGIHICKSMLAYKKFGKNKAPDKKSDHFVGDFYVMFNKEAEKDKDLEKEALEMLNKWEQHDKETIALWKKMNTWAVDGFIATYKRFNLKFDKIYNESEIYDKGKAVVMAGLKKGVFFKDEDGAVAIDLGKELGKKVLLRADGTSIYITQDLYLAEEKFKAFNPDKSVYVVGSEQNYHFKVLFKVLELLGFKEAKHCYHLSYGMVNLPEGRMKSREGTVVDADDILDEMQALAEKELKKRYESLKEKEIKERAEKIAMAAIRFFLLKIDSSQEMVFNPEQSISFEGDTGPYLQYTYARIASIFEKYGKKLAEKDFKADFSLLKDEKEAELIKLLELFKDKASVAAEQYKPHLIANYLLELAHAFNEFYHKCPILQEKEELKMARLVLAYCVQQVLKSGLKLLEIDVLERM